MDPEVNDFVNSVAKSSADMPEDVQSALATLMRYASSSQDARLFRTGNNCFGDIGEESLSLPGVRDMRGFQHTRLMIVLRRACCFVEGG
jgi:hypothetical protein